MPTDSPPDVRPRWQDDPTVKEMRERVMQDIAVGGPSDPSRPWPSLTELCEAVAVASLPRVGPSLAVYQAMERAIDAIAQDEHLATDDELYAAWKAGNYGGCATCKAAFILREALEARSHPTGLREQVEDLPRHARKPGEKPVYVLLDAVLRLLDGGSE